MNSGAQEFAIEEVELKDLEELYRLELECFGEEDSYSKLTLKILLMDPRSVAFKAVTRNGLVAGFAIARIEEIPGKTIGRIYTLNVDPRFRRRGLAKALMRRIEEECAAHGCMELVLEVAVDNRPALELYKSLGFEMVRVLRNYYGPGRHAYQARKVLGESIIGVDGGVSRDAPSREDIRGKSRDELGGDS